MQIRLHQHIRERERDLIMTSCFRSEREMQKRSGMQRNADWGCRTNAPTLEREIVFQAADQVASNIHECETNITHSVTNIQVVVWLCVDLTKLNEETQSQLTGVTILYIYCTMTT